MNYRFEIIEKYPRITIIHQRCDNGDLLATAKRTILQRKAGAWQATAEFPRCYPRDLFGFSRPTARAMRADKCNLYANQHGKLLGIRGGWAYAIEGGTVTRLFEIQGDCVLHRAISEDGAGNIYFGEYFMNPERRAVCIWRVAPDLKSWEAAAELPGIRHVHGIYPDPFNPATFWVTVGDFAGECYLLRTRDHFRTMERFGDGSQTWRAVNLFFTADSVNWLTDSNLETNHACRMTRRNGKLEIGQEIDCSAWYGGTTHEGLHVAFTTVEKGPAIRSNESAVLVSADAFHWQKIFSFKKDFWKPVKVFKYGVIALPSGELSLEEVYLSGEGLVGLDGCSLKAAIREDGATHA